MNNKEEVNENEPKPRNIQITKVHSKKTRSINGFGIFMHVLAGLTLAYGFISTIIVETPTSMQQSVQALWQIKYILYAIFYEIVALNCRKFYKD